MSFAQRLRDARTEKGITQAELARMVGVSRSTICNYEKGNRETPSTPVIMAIAEALHVPISTFISKEEFKRRVPQVTLRIEIPQQICNEMFADEKDDSACRETHEEYIRLLTAYRKLNPRRREMVLELAEALALIPMTGIGIDNPEMRISSMPEDIQCDAER